MTSSQIENKYIQSFIVINLILNTINNKDYLKKKRDNTVTKLISIYQLNSIFNLSCNYILKDNKYFLIYNSQNTHLIDSI